ncbi:MAG: hypothetical protein QXL94_02640 [Candidatus Parvarchaeum sp.]
MTKQKSKKTNPLLYVLAGIGVAAIIVVIVLLLWGASRNNNFYTTTISYYSTSQPTTSLQIITHTETLGYSQGYVFSISPGSYNFDNFTVPSGVISVSSLMGSYTSSGAVEVAIMTPTQYGAFTANHNELASDNIYYYGDTQGSTIDASLSAGQYVIVFYDPGIFTTDTVTIINPIHFNYTAYG